MNEYIFFTSEGTTYPPIEGKEADNCQLLGRAKGNTSEEAKSNLLKDNPWIEDAGFDSACIMVEQILTEEQQKDIQTLVECLYEKCFDSSIFKIIERLKTTINSSIVP